MVEGVKCPEGHTRVWRKGCVPTRQGPKVRYVCFTCGRTFYKPKAVRKPMPKKSK